MVNSDSTTDAAAATNESNHPSKLKALNSNLSTAQPPQSQPQPQQQQQPSEEDLHLNKLRQLLGAGQRLDAIELAMKYNMWPHALFLASSFSNQSGAIGGASSTSLQLMQQSQSISALNTATLATTSTSGTINVSNSVATISMMNAISESKSLQKVKTRFINSLHSNDPIQTCYQLLIGRVPSVANVIYFYFSFISFLN